MPASGTEALPLLDSLNPLTWVRASNRLVRHKPDLVILPWWVSYYAPLYLAIIVLVRCRLRTRVLFLCHNVVEHDTGLLKRAVSRAVLSRGNCFIVHSSTEKERLIHLTGNTAVVQTPHPTYGAFNTGRMSKSAARKKLSLRDRRVLLFFGFVRPYKGLDYLLQAMPIILRRLPARLLIVGEFWEDAERYRRRIRDLDLEDAVTVVDRYIRNEEIPLYFHAADLVILPYVSVTGSGLLQLAFGFETPVVASRLGALAEAVRHGKTGILVKPRDPQAIARAVVDFYRGNRAREMAAQIRKEAGRFSWGRLVEAIEKLAGSDGGDMAVSRTASPSSRPGRLASTGKRGSSHRVPGT